MGTRPGQATRSCVPAVTKPCFKEQPDRRQRFTAARHACVRGRVKRPAPRWHQLRSHRGAENHLPPTTGNAGSAASPASPRTPNPGRRGEPPARSPPYRETEQPRAHAAERKPPAPPPRPGTGTGRLPAAPAREQSDTHLAGAIPRRAPRRAGAREGGDKGGA